MPCHAYACPKGTKYQDLFIYIKFHISMSRFIYLHQVSYINVKISMHMLRFAYVCNKIKIHISIFARQYIKCNKYSTSFEHRHQTSHIHIMVRIPTSKYVMDQFFKSKIADKLHAPRFSYMYIEIRIYIEIMIGLYEVQSDLC